MLFMKYKKEFKKLLDYYHVTGSRTVRSDTIKIELERLEYLAACYVITLTPFEHIGKYYKITITDYGLRFFDEQHDKIFRFIIPVAISIVSLIISLVK